MVRPANMTVEGSSLGSLLYVLVVGRVASISEQERSAGLLDGAILIMVLRHLLGEPACRC